MKHLIISLHSPVASSMLIFDILNILFTNTLNLRSPLGKKGHVSHRSYIIKIYFPILK